MAQTLTPATAPTAGSHLVLYDISWEMYEKLLELFAEHPALRMTYYKGTLELMTPLPEHETYAWILGRLVAALSEELGVEIRGLKSTTWRSKPKTAGKEADECFYIQNEPLVRGKLKIDLSVDPPPDLAIEIDATHSSIDKMAVYTELKVHILSDTGYVESETSLAFGSFPVKELARFMQPDPQKGENARLREFRQWVRQQSTE